MGEVIHIACMVRKLDNPPNRIREQRKARRMTLEAVAIRLNTTRTQISRFETGERIPDYTWLRRIADALDTNVGQLLNPEDNPDSLSEAERAVIEAMRAGDMPAALRAVADRVQQYGTEPSDLSERRKRA